MQYVIQIHVDAQTHVGAPADLLQHRSMQALLREPVCDEYTA